MIPPEMRGDDAPSSDENTDYDHMERLRYVDTQVTQEEKTLLSDVLASALPGLERLLGDDRHNILKGKMRYNSIGVGFNGGRDDKVRRDDSLRVLRSSFEQPYAARADRPPGGHREDTYTDRHLETDRYCFLLRLQLRESHTSLNTLSLTSF